MCVYIICIWTYICHMHIYTHHIYIYIYINDSTWMKMFIYSTLRYSLTIFYFKHNTFPRIGSSIFKVIRSNIFKNFSRPAPLLPAWIEYSLIWGLKNYIFIHSSIINYSLLIDRLGYLWLYLQLFNSSFTTPIGNK